MQLRKEIEQEAPSNEEEEQQENQKYFKMQT